MKQEDIKNQKIKNHTFLKEMYQDAYFPDFLVDKGKNILVELCLKIKNQEPKSLNKLYKLTHSATNGFNDLEEEFLENGTEIETGARDCIGMNFEFIANSYDFNADIEELTATRDW